MDGGGTVCLCLSAPGWIWSLSLVEHRQSGVAVHDAQTYRYALVSGGEGTSLMLTDNLGAETGFDSWYSFFVSPDILSLHWKLNFTWKSNVCGYPTCRGRPGRSWSYALLCNCTSTSLELDLKCLCSPHTCVSKNGMDKKYNHNFSLHNSMMSGFLSGLFSRADLRGLELRQGSENDCGVESGFVFARRAACDQSAQ